MLGLLLGRLRLIACTDYFNTLSNRFGSWRGELVGAINAEHRGEAVGLHQELTDRIAGAQVVTTDMRPEVTLKPVQHPAHVLAEFRRPDAREAHPHMVAFDEQAASPAEQHVRWVSASQVDYLDDAQGGRVGNGDLAVNCREVDVAIVDQAVV